MVDGSSQPMTEFTVDQGHGVKLNGFSSLLLFATILVVVFSLVIFVYQLTLNRQVTSLKSQEADLLSIINLPDNQKLEQLVNGTADSIALLKTLKAAGEYKMSNFTDDFPKLVNTNVVINNLSVDAEMMVKIDASTASQGALSKFMQSLQDSAIFKDVTLISSGNSGTDAKTATSFSVSAQVDKAAAQEELRQKAQPVTTTTPLGTEPSTIQTP